MLIIPENYEAALGIRETEVAIKKVKDFFQQFFQVGMVADELPSGYGDFAACLFHGHGAVELRFGGKGTVSFVIARCAVFLSLQVVAESVGSLSTGHGLIAVPEISLHLPCYGDGASFVVYPGIRFGGFNHHTVAAGDASRDATTQVSGANEQPPALVVVKFPPCPLLVEEGFALKVPVKLFQCFRPYILQRLPYQQVDSPLEVVCYFFAFIHLVVSKFVVLLPVTSHTILGQINL